MKAKAYIFIIIILIMSSVTISSYSLRKAYQAKSRATQAESRATQAETNMKLLRLATVIRNTMSNRGERNFQKAINIRNRIYKQVPLKRTPKMFNFMDIDDSYLRSLRDETVGHICGGLASTYATALESQGIPARYVGIFSKDKQPYKSHATIEFWHEEKWYASDPTFNVMFRCQGEYLSYSELYELIQKGEPYEVVSNGFPVFPKRAIENYYIKLDDLTKYMVIHPSEVWSGGKRLEYPMKLFPETWDGAITFDDGKRRDVKNFGGIYKYLNQGPLR